MELKLFFKYAAVPAYLVYLKHSKTNLNLAVDAFLMLKIDRTMHCKKRCLSFRYCSFRRYGFSRQAGKTEQVKNTLFLNTEIVGRIALVLLKCWVL